MFQECEWLLISMRSVLWRSLGALAILTIRCSFSIVNSKVKGEEEMSLETNTSALCEPGWMLQGELCYLLTYAWLTWYEAQEYCRSMNGLLAEVQDGRELRALNDFMGLTASSINELWIGLSNQQEDNNWTWGSGRSMKFSNWIPTERNNSDGNESCVSVWPSSDSSWHDISCNRTLRGVCQKGSWNGNSTLRSDTAVIRGGTLAAVVCSAIGALVIVVISIYLWQRKPWKKHSAERVCDVRQATNTLPQRNKCVPQREHHLNECSDSSRFTPHELGVWSPTNFPIGEEEYYEEIIDHTQNTYCQLDAQPTSPTNIYDITLKYEMVPS